MKHFLLQCLIAGALVSGCARKEAALLPKDAIAGAWLNYRLGEFDEAIKKFECAIQASDERSEDRLQASFGLATTWSLRRPGEDIAKAETDYQQILSTWPDHDLAAWSSLALARMKHLVPVGENPNYDEVRRLYQNVMDRYPNHLAAKEAFIYLNATRVATLNEEETQKAIAALEEYVQRPGETVFLNPAYSLLAVSYTTLHLPEKRLQAEIRALETMEVDPTNPYTDFSWNYWNIATIAEFEVGDFETARKYYHKLIDEYPTDIRKYGALTALRRMDDLEAKIRSELGGPT